MRWRTVLRFNHADNTMLVKRLGSDSGRQFVLVHGIGVATRYFARLAAVLAEHGGVHAVELPGHGAAPKPDRPLSIEDYADIVSAYVRGAGLEQPLLVGHSMGGQVALEAAAQHPELFPRIVIMGTVTDPRERTLLQQGLRLAQDTLKESPSGNWAVFSDYLRTGPRWYLATAPAMIDYRTEVTAARITAETLVLRGGRDPISRRQWSEQLTRLLAHSRFVEVPGQPHVLMHGAPQEVADHLIRFAATGLAAEALDGTGSATDAARAPEPIE